MWGFVASFATLAFMSLPAQAQEPGRLDNLTKSARDYLPSISMPAMPDFSVPDLAAVGSNLNAQFTAFTAQVGETLPEMEAMGYEVTTFRVQWGLPPRARLRLRSRADAIDLAKAEALAAKPRSGVIATSLMTSAIAARRIQNAMKLGTAILDIDFAVPPKVRMSFLKAKDASEKDVPDPDAACVAPN